MKRSKIATIYFISSTLCSISGTIHFLNSNSDMGAIQIALGSTFLYLGIYYKRSIEKKCDNANNK